MSIPRGTLPTRREVIRATGGRAREPVSAKVKKKVRERAKNTCERKYCREKEGLQFHHKNMKNDDNRVKNVILLCLNHHAKTHRETKRKVYERDVLGNPLRARVVKKKPKTKKRKITSKKRDDLDWLMKV